MASEIRVNKINNRAGLGTVTYTDTGIIVSGIVTANSFKGDGSSLTGIDATALKDSAGNVKVQANTSGIVVTGISTFSGTIEGPNIIKSTGNNPRLTLTESGTSKVINILLDNSRFTIRDGTGSPYPMDMSEIDFTFNKRVVISKHLEVGPNIELGNAGVITATSFVGDGSSLSNLPASAPVGGASTNTVFFENDKAVAVNYQITSTKNAMSAGPLTINAGIAVTVPSGSSWTIV